MDLLSEEEQWERLKIWLRANVPSIIVMVLVMLLGWYGWQWWQGRSDAEALEANVAYEKALDLFDQNKGPEALAQIEALRTQFPKSPYVSAADLIAAKVFVARNELDNAVQRLERVARESPDEKLRPVAKLRLARVQAAQGQYDKALATLGASGTGAHESAWLEVRGDVLLAKGDKAAALKDYEAARRLLTPTETGAGGVGELLDLKIADLRDAAAVPAASAAPAAAPSAPAPESKP